MAWHLAKSLEVFRDQVNQKWPKRDRSSDGTIGDQAHAARKSEHNPDPVTGAVRAIDITNDPDHGLNCAELVESLRASKDPRIMYLIWNRKIWNPSVSADWRNYTGSNPHDKHLHMSVKKESCEDDALWLAVGKAVVSEVPPGVPAGKLPLLRFGMRGDAVKILQLLLGLPTTGLFDATTETSVKALQKKQGLLDDGIVGPYTWGSMVGKTTSP